MSEILERIIEEINDRLYKYGTGEANLGEVCWATSEAMERKDIVELFKEEGGSILQQLYNTRNRGSFRVSEEEQEERRLPPNKGVKTGGVKNVRRFNTSPATWGCDYWVALSRGESRQKLLSAMTRDDVKERIEMLTSYRDSFNTEIKKWSSVLSVLRTGATIGEKFSHQQILDLKLHGLKKA